ncbi:hypothetical protein [Niemeyer virus]|uniref:Uncharacterized protein n=1 Tax=Acanthamoeba polyphaga mimivirus Kroon TaxID=3069720 RepID=A0A0G2Y712_9VIRU|nr:hypothetical protein QJ850_gp320 [Acanthamoeba polyphaga mimivirus]AKI80379.1 hypothetical protein [Acanthamoeba polyphaga mimivirus Kroon]ALR84299.1 hypothetical protein [Niemeyer virus]
MWVNDINIMSYQAMARNYINGKWRHAPNRADPCGICRPVPLLCPVNGGACDPMGPCGLAASSKCSPQCGPCSPNFPYPTGPGGTTICDFAAAACGGATGNVCSMCPGGSCGGFGGCCGANSPCGLNGTVGCGGCGTGSGCCGSQVGSGFHLARGSCDPNYVSGCSSPCGTCRPPNAPSTLCDLALLGISPIPLGMPVSQSVTTLGIPPGAVPPPPPVPVTGGVPPFGGPSCGPTVFGGGSFGGSCGGGSCGGGSCGGGSCGGGSCGGGSCGGKSGKKDCCKSCRKGKKCKCKKKKCCGVEQFSVCTDGPSIQIGGPCASPPPPIPPIPGVGVSYDTQVGPAIPLNQCDYPWAEYWPWVVGSWAGQYTNEM